MSKVNKVKFYQTPAQCEAEEIDVLDQVVKGSNNATIAEALQTDEETVRSIFESLMRRTGKNRIQLAVWYTRFQMSQGGNV